MPSSHSCVAKRLIEYPRAGFAPAAHLMPLLPFGEEKVVPERRKYVIPHLVVAHKQAPHGHCSIQPIPGGN